MGLRIGRTPTNKSEKLMMRVSLSRGWLFLRIAVAGRRRARLRAGCDAAAWACGVLAAADVLQAQSRDRVAARHVVPATGRQAAGSGRRRSRLVVIVRYPDLGPGRPDSHTAGDCLVLAVVGRHDHPAARRM